MPVRSDAIARRTAPRALSQPQGPAPRATAVVRADAFVPKRSSSGAIALGSRAGGPGALAITKAGALTLEGKATPAAMVEAARMVETGLAPFAHLAPAQSAAVLRSLSDALAPRGSGKPTAALTLQRSAAATLLLSLARSSEGPVRKQAVQAYVAALVREGHPLLQKSMLKNLDATHLELPAATRKSLEAARAHLLPPRPPYERWFKGPKPTLKVQQYVMDEFVREELFAWKRRGFTVVKQAGQETTLEGTLKDPNGKAPDVKVTVTLHQTDENVLRDLSDPETDVILYSGHSQYGGVLDGALAQAPKRMKGDKLIQIFNCRGKQSQAEVLARYPKAHLTTTWSSAYGPDDAQVLDATFKMIAARADYSAIKKTLTASTMIMPESNYMLPDDPRSLGVRDDDRDGLLNSSVLGPDRFFDPGRLALRGGSHVFRPTPVSQDPQELSGAKLEHAVGYANTSFFYFSEENRASPLTVRETDRFVPAGWFVSDDAEPVRIKEVQRGGETHFQISVNSRFAERSREVITSMVLQELQEHLSVRDHGSFTADDRLRGLVLVSGYLDLYCEDSDTIDAVLEGFSKKYGFEGVTYEKVFKAMKKDGDESTATRAALTELARLGVGVR